MLNKKKKKTEENQEQGQKITLSKDDVALVLRGDGRCETICTLKGKHSLSQQEELIIGLSGLLQNEKFANSVREHFHKTMMDMLSSKYIEDMESTSE